MNESATDKVKIRFRFRSGEEFEAEGNPSFIEQQRADFLQLIGKAEKTSRHSSRQNNAYSDGEIPPSTPPTEYPSEIVVSPVEIPAQNTEPAFYRRKITHDAHAIPTRASQSMTPNSWDIDGNGGKFTSDLSLSAAERRQSGHPSSGVSSADARLWEQVVRTDDRFVYLRRKSRLLSPNTAALVLLAAAKVLLSAVVTDGYSALALAKSLKKSGYGGERLDRVLAADIKQGLIRSYGSKRARAYTLSNEGYTKAFVLAGKLAEEWR